MKHLLGPPDYLRGTERYTDYYGNTQAIFPTPAVNEETDNRPVRVETTLSVAYAQQVRNLRSDDSTHTKLIEETHGTRSGN
jgi:hypothetical protein